MGVVHGWGKYPISLSRELVKRYEIRPTYKFFPFVWYDLIEEQWVLGMLRPLDRTILATRQRKKIIIGMAKLMK